jgi:hypothetical protein
VGGVGILTRRALGGGAETLQFLPEGVQLRCILVKRRDGSGWRERRHRRSRRHFLCLYGCRSEVLVEEA